MLQVTTATTLMAGNVDEQLIMERTGHRSIGAVRTYKRPTSDVQKQVSDLLQPPVQRKVAATDDKVGVDNECVTTKKIPTKKTPTCTITSSDSLEDNIKVEPQVAAPLDIVMRNLGNDSDGNANGNRNVNTNDDVGNVSVTTGDIDQEDILIKVLKGHNLVEIKL